MDFNNKIVWITGASGGIGEAIAEAFAAEGARLVISARNEEALNRVAINLKKGGAATVMVLPLDLSDTTAMKGHAHLVFEKMGPVDILINNGGISQRTRVEETSMEIYRQVMEVNYFGTIALTLAVLPQMLARKSGNIVTITSLTGKIGAQLRSGYAASKHALHGFFDSLRAEVQSRQINIMLVCPGFIKTNVSMNALNAVGKPTGVMDENQLKGMLPEKLAQKILAGLRNNRQEIYVGGREVLSIYLKRFFPKMIANILRKKF